MSPLLKCLLFLSLTCISNVQGDDSSYTSYGDGGSGYQATNTYSAPAPAPQYMRYQMVEQEEMEAKTKEDKKCAVKLVLPPLIIITVFLGLLLLHLVVPTLLPAIVNPIALPLVAVIQVFTNPLVQPLLPIIGPNGRDVHPVSAFDDIMHMTEIVTAVVAEETCLARYLCESGRDVSHDSKNVTKLISKMLPENYSEYLKLVSSDNKKCQELYKCSAFDKRKKY